MFNKYKSVLTYFTNINRITYLFQIITHKAFWYTFKYNQTSFKFVLEK